VWVREREGERREERRGGGGGGGGERGRKTNVNKIILEGKGTGGHSMYPSWT